jgi:hypothetical protein
MDLCTEADIATVLSYAGLDYRGDNDRDGLADSVVVANSIGRASDELQGELTGRYDMTSATSNRLVKAWCAVIAAFYVCQVRGNPVPEILQADFERITGRPDGLLARARSGLFVIPGLDQTSNRAPTWHNLRIDRRYVTEKIRVIRSNSTPVQSKLEVDELPQWLRG